MKKIRYTTNVIAFFLILSVIHGIINLLRGHSFFSLGVTVMPEYERINALSILGIRILAAMWMSSTYPLFKTKKKGDII